MRTGLRVGTKRATFDFVQFRQGILDNLPAAYVDPNSDVGATGAGELGSGNQRLGIKRNLGVAIRAADVLLVLHGRTF